MRSINEGKGGVRRGAGRKPYSDPSKVRSTRIVFALTESEAAKVKRAAGKEPVSSFVRDIVLKHLAAKRRK